jgi:hypothetical protein
MKTFCCKCKKEILNESIFYIRDLDYHFDVCKKCWYKFELLQKTYHKALMSHKFENIKILTKRVK